MASLALEGRWVNYGLMGGAIVSDFQFGKMLGKRASLIFTTLRTRSDEYKAQLMGDLAEKVIVELKTGSYKPIIDKVFKMSEATEAHKYMESNANIGKIILKNDL